MKEKKIELTNILWMLAIIYWLLLSYAHGFYWLNNRAWDNMDCQRDSMTKFTEYECKNVNLGLVYWTNGIKFLSAPVWSPLIIIGQQVYK